MTQTLPATRPANGQLTTPPKASVLKEVIGLGDLSRLSDQEKLAYYNAVCESLGLNPLTKPFEFVKLSGRETMYATKGCADQLRKINGVSIVNLTQDIRDGLCIVQVTARAADGREDSDVGVLPLGNLQGDAKANLMMKCVTKAKRRVTLSICGLGFLDETEVETIKHTPVKHPAVTVKTAEPEPPPVVPNKSIPLSTTIILQDIEAANTLAKLNAVYLDLEKSAASKDASVLESVPVLLENYFMKRIEGCRKVGKPEFWASTAEQFKKHSCQMETHTAATVADILKAEGGMA